MASITPFPNIIDKLTFNKWTSAWENFVDDDCSKIFYRDHPNSNLFQIKSYFVYDDVLSFLSTVGIATVKVRFGICEKERFQVILFGVDAKQNIMTPYYCSQPYYIDEVKELDDPLLTPLVNIWTKNWRQSHLKTDKKLFKIYNNEILKGYNYPFREILDAFQPAITQDKRWQVDLLFAIHKYPRSNADGDIVWRNTFGIVFHPFAPLLDQTLTDKDPPGPYFDVTTPCPQTC